MNFVDFMQLPFFQLPLDRSAVSFDFLDYIKSTFREYHDSIAKLSTRYFEASHVTRSRELTNGITEAIEHYYNGSPYKAYEALVKAINIVSPDLDKIINGALWASDHDENLFRMRCCDNRPHTIEEMCHVPFELRHLIATQRYSIPGYPSLYLASSVYVAWKELRQPPQKDKVYTVKMTGAEKLKVIDFSYTPQYLLSVYNIVAGKGYQREEEYIASYIVCWPLLASCAVRSKFSSAQFKSEYIIPQLLLQAIRNNAISGGFDGIKYFSMSASHLELERQRLHNYVFPVKTSKPTGLCDFIKSSFKSTPPLSWSDFILIRSGVDKTKCYSMEIEMPAGMLVRYCDTEIGEYEAKLYDLPEAAYK